MTDSDNIRESILRRLRDAFPEQMRPVDFTNRAHCDECEEHHQTLAGKSQITLTREDLGQPGWDPITFATEEGYLYYMPSFCRVVMDCVGENCYLEQFLDQMNGNRIEGMNPLQSSAVHDFLCFLRLSRAESLDAEDKEVLDRRILALFNQSRRKSSTAATSNESA